MTINSKKRKVINKLTEEEKTLAKNIGFEWLEKLGKIPLNKSKVRKAVDWMYTNSNLKPPQWVVYVKSPKLVKYAYAKLSDPEFGEIIDGQDVDITTEDLEKYESDFIVSVGNRGSVYDWHWAAFYDFLEKINFELDNDYIFFKDYCCLSGAIDYVFYENCTIVVKQPVSIKFDKNYNLHCDGGAALEWEDGSKVYILNGITVPEYLAVTPKEKLDINFYFTLDNADAKAEFVRKFGIENMTNLGTLLDSYKNYDNYWWNASEYEVYDMSPVYTTLNKALYLKMKHQSMNDLYCLEGLPNECDTIQKALNFRASYDLSGYDIINIK